MVRAIHAALILALVALCPVTVQAQSPSTGGAFLPSENYVLSGTWHFLHAAPLVLEGATADEYETTIVVADPTADNTWTFPDATDTVLGAASNQTISGDNTLSGDNVLSGHNTVTGRWSVRESFDQGFFIHQDDMTAKSVTDAEVNIVHGSPMGVISYREELTKTASSWIVADGTLDISADDTTNDEGVEIVFMGVGTNTTEGVLVAGTHAGCIAVNLTVTNISATDQVQVGWRQNETFVDANAYAGYTIFNTVGINATDGSIVSSQEVGEATDTDDSGVNWADTETRTLKVCVSAAGVPTAFYSDDDDPDASNAITMTETGSTLTAGTQLWPYFSFMHGAESADAGVILNWVEFSAP